MNQLKPQELIEFRKRFKISQGRMALKTGMTSYEIGQFEQGKLKLTERQHQAVIFFINETFMELVAW